tara:strand:- start:2 stop:799 length:798 start_codon:yes stop_codon:yes gene_type:complete
MTEPNTRQIAIAETHGGVEANPGPTLDAMAIWQSIEQMAMNPDVDAAKFASLVSIQTQLMDRAAQQAFTLAKNSAMMEMPRITKDAKIVHPGKNGAPDRLIGRYKKYEDLRAVIDPVLTSHGLRLTHDTGASEEMKMPTVTAVLSFVGNGLAWTERGGPMVIPFDSTGAKSGAQGAGSSLTYGQRYTTCAILGIVIENEDNDGHRVGQTVPSDVPQGLLDAGFTAASKGSKVYGAWLKSLNNADKGLLITTGEHDKLTEAARNYD